MSYEFYLWNITNPDKIKEGDKPNLVEVGPFKYSQIVERKNYTISDDNRIVKYRNYQNIVKISNKTAMITTMNGPFLIIDYILEQLPIQVRKLVEVFLIENDYGPIVTMSADKLIFGYEDPLLALLNKYIPQLVPIKDFGYFYGQNGTESKVFEGKTGFQDISQWMKIISYDNQNHLTLWSTKYANMINGTDGYGFSPMVPDSPFIFIDQMCRSVSLDLDEKNGLFYKYSLDWSTFDSVAKRPSNIGFCTDGYCPRNGIFNMTGCLETQFGFPVPIAATFPHLINVDSFYSDQIITTSSTVCQNGTRNFQTFAEIEQLSGLGTATTI